jgi:hypothetical protein
MAKDNKAKVRVFFGEIEGDNDTIRDGLKSIAAAVNKTFTTETRIVRVLTAKNTDNGEVWEENPALAAELGTESVDDDEPENGTASRPKRPKKALSYSFVKSLNLRPDGKPSLRDFFASKKPQNQQEQMAVVVYYLTKTLEATNVGSNHLYTCLKDVEVPVPADIGQIVRNTAARKNWIDSSNGDDLKVTVSGENFVEHDLPSKTSAKGK